METRFLKILYCLKEQNGNGAIINLANAWFNRKNLIVNKLIYNCFLGQKYVQLYNLSDSEMFPLLLRNIRCISQGMWVRYIPCRSLTYTICVPFQLLMSPPSLAENFSVSSPYQQVLDRGTGTEFILKLIYNIDKMILYNYDQTVVLY